MCFTECARVAYDFTYLGSEGVIGDGFLVDRSSDSCWIMPAIPNGAELDTMERAFM
ncbi:MAG: hypothetical protein HRT57_10305 [Crocinitomicaceae bacterium]|nr:hypothetical protein [Crocinitomicaceae bacterium]